MDQVSLAALVTIAMFLAIFFGVPIGIAMGMFGMIGFAALTAMGPALSLLGVEFISALGSNTLSVIPLFLLMAGFAVIAELPRDLYRLATALLGHRPGGLAIATICGCAGFGSVCGSSIATVATFARISVPEMRARGYSLGLAGGTVAAGGTLGSLIPPAVIMIVYANLVEISVLEMFKAAIIPGLLAVLLYCVAIIVYVRLTGDGAAVEARASWRDRWLALRSAWRTVLLLVVMIGGMYGGLFTVNEAASFGMILTLAFCWTSGRLTYAGAIDSLKNAMVNTAMIYTVVVGAGVLGYFYTLTGAPAEVIKAISGLGLEKYQTIFLLIVFFVIAGAIFDEVAVMLLTMPFVIPIIQGFGGDLVWWGVVNITVIGIGLLAPPMGMNVIFLKVIIGGSSYREIYRGVTPFLAADLVRLALVAGFPALSLWLV